MPEYLTIDEASKLVDHSEKTIRRFIRKLLMDNAAFDSEKIKLGKGESGFNYTIEREFLIEQFERMKSDSDDSIYGKEYTDSIAPATQKAKFPQKKYRKNLLSLGSSQDAGVITKLVDQLEHKDKLVSELLERIKELNAIVKDLQIKITYLETKDLQDQETSEFESPSHGVTTILDQDQSHDEQ